MRQFYGQQWLPILTGFLEMEQEMPQHKKTKKRVSQASKRRSLNSNYIQEAIDNVEGEDNVIKQSPIISIPAKKLVDVDIESMSPKKKTKKPSLKYGFLFI